LAATIERDRNSICACRLFHIGPQGNLTLYGLGLRFGRGSGGGAIFNRGALTVEKVAIYENENIAIQVNRGGGGIFLDFPSTVSLKVIDSEISRNRAEASGDDNFGGGIAGGFGPIEIIRSSIFENSARSGGGGLVVNGPTIIRDSSIHNNKVLTGVNFSLGGGGIFADSGSSVTLINSTVARNRLEQPSGFGGGTVDPNTVRFGATGTEAAPVNVGRRDVDGDGDRDMVVRFQIQDTGIKCGDTSAVLTGQISNGPAIIGSSPIQTVQCGPIK
jgi:hypothetical protein